MPEWLSGILEWIRANPGMAGLTIGLVAFLEGLALVGIVVPGIILLFGFGALIGLGILDLATVWIWCSAGAIAGDGVSFWLGHHFKDHIRDVWPFSRFTSLISRGQLFFRRHGLKSVVIGRFVGPVRPIMPVVAGMMEMPLNRYLPANVIAGVVWAPAYLLPGVVFGASIELAQAVAWRLALLLCVLAALVWIIVTIARTAYRVLSPHTTEAIDLLTRWAHRHPVIGQFARTLVDPTRPESRSLTLFGVMLVMAAWGLASMLITMPLGGTTELDRSVAGLMATVRTPWADGLMIYFNGLGSLLVLLPAASLVVVWLFWRRRPLAAWHWLAAVAMGVVLALVMGLLLGWTRQPPGPEDDFYRPIMHVAMAVVTYGFFAILIARTLPHRSRAWPYVVATSLVVLISFARLYLEAHWFSDLMIGLLLGLIWIIAIGIAYRRRVRRSFWIVPPAVFFFGSVILMSVVYMSALGERILTDLRTDTPTVLLSASQWWENGIPPAAANEGRANFQFAGDIDVIAEHLRSLGWEESPTATWKLPLAMLQPSPDRETLPLLPEGYNNSREVLVLTKAHDSPSHQTVLRLWHTGARLSEGAPIYAGQLGDYGLTKLLYFFYYWRRQDLLEPVSAFSGLDMEDRQRGNLLLLRSRQSD